jgi:hypothetical protein
MITQSTTQTLPVTSTLSGLSVNPRKSADKQWFIWLHPIVIQVRLLLWFNDLAISWKHFRLHVIFTYQLTFGIFFLRLFGNKRYCLNLEDRISQLPDGTIGKEVWRFLQTNKLRLVPYYETHDLKHVILGYSTDPEDEMRMQAFMFGNAGFSPFITTVYCVFVIWTPEVWREFNKHYTYGKRVKNISQYKIEDIAAMNLAEFRRDIGVFSDSL